MAPHTIHEFSATTNRGDVIDFAALRGHPLLLVNTASHCGYAPQLAGLQALHETYADRGLVVIGFPSDQFKQEFSDEGRIEEFCRVNYGVTFPMTRTIDVNGNSTDPVFAFLKDQTNGLLGSRIKWNFTKFLVAPDGMTVTRYSPSTPPASLTGDIEALLPDQAVA